MFPQLPVHDHADQSATDVVRTHQVGLSCSSRMSLANISNGLFREHRHAVPRPLPTGVSAFLDAVLRIVFRRAKEQMLRVHAERVVARMQDPPVTWNSPEVESKTDPVGRVLDFAAFRHLSVAVCQDKPTPSPALIGTTNFHVSPEPFFHGRGPRAREAKTASTTRSDVVAPRTPASSPGDCHEPYYV